MLTHDFRAFPFAIFRSSRLPELAGIFTFRIIGTSDKGAETTAAQRQFSVIAKRAGTRIAAVPLVGKQHGFKKFIEFGGDIRRSEEHTSELQSLMRISYAVFCLKKKKK